MGIIYGVNSDDLIGLANDLRAVSKQSGTLIQSIEFRNAVQSFSNKIGSLVNKSITTITAEDLAGVTIIGDYAFSHCYELTSVTIPSSVTSRKEVKKNGDNKTRYNTNTYHQT